ncbi:MAG: LysM peptidoglycan-binding domain-containing protein [Calditrichaeota bacterium]|nr:MAG: LysM peptidoglycan-binding domain-containing protein [Calditrichota bacterium]MBL1205685.1 LysM peptidoglycan-binding domain-containing protein [Calditrichota bacterium]NOG45513.1 LysM peptidoglycan-binding domain-containing protein [Calditrichota bacterium]
MIIRKIFIITILVLSGNIFSSEINYSSKNLFPMHKELEPAVRFWIDVYGKYGTNQYIIHDSRKLGIVYEVAKIGIRNGGYADEPLSKSQKKTLKGYVKKYKDILKAIAAVYPDSTKLKPEQRKILRQLTSFKSKQDFLLASRRVRAQKGQKNRFRHGMEISGRYMPYLKKIFKEYNLPNELTILPHVESSFNYKAYSSVGAAGIWQFTRSTGKQFLKISYEIDERLDPILATEASAKLLSRNFKGVGHWPLAITAYNSGLSGMKRAVRKLKTTDINTIVKKYKSRYFKFASRNFYAEFLAALHVVQNYQKYFGIIQFELPIKYKELQLPQYLKYSSLSRFLEMDKNQFRTYNPALRPSIFNNSKYIPKGYRLRLPASISTDSLLAAIPKAAYLASQKRSEYYRIRYGDTLDRIARKFGTSVNQLLAINNISNPHFIRRGMTIRIPDKKRQKPLLASIEPKVELAHVDLFRVPDPEKKSTLDIQFFDTGYGWLDSNMTEPKITYANSKDSADLEIEFIKKENPAIGYIRVEPEETLGHYAEWLQVRTQQIRNWNSLSFQSPIGLDQKIKIVFNKISADDFNRIRLEYHRGIEEDFFTYYEITDTLTHTVKNGDNIWYLSNYEYNLPYWLIVDFNKDIDFGALKVGDKLVIPAIKSKS